MREDVRRRSDERAACVIVKHANPCGAAIAETPLAAYGKAFATDPVSAFGGIIAFNRPVDAATLEAVAAQFLEVLIAPGYTADALAVIAQKKNVRVLEVALQRPGRARAARHEADRWRPPAAERRREQCRCPPSSRSSPAKAPTPGAARAT